MRKTALFFTLLITSLFLLSPATIAYGQEIGDIPLHGNTPPGDIPRTPAIIPMSCYYVTVLNYVIIQSSSLNTTAQVEIVNTTTGAVVNEIIVINAIPSMINLPGPGSYTIIITLPSGEEYSGVFII